MVLSSCTHQPSKVPNLPFEGEITQETILDRYDSKTKTLDLSGTNLK